LANQDIETFPAPPGRFVSAVFDSSRRSSAPPLAFFLVKRGFDLLTCLLLVPLLAIAAVGLLLVNPFWNAGPLLFVQTRMGQGCKPFRAIKFRSMTAVSGAARGAHDPLEHDRITPLGHFIRKSRIDELPQILNVLMGQMSLIGPRPDFYDHAVEYVRSIPGYRARHAVKPGISGFAQTEVGYADSADMVASKVKADLFYIRNRRLIVEFWLVWRTLVTVLGRHGA